MALAATIDFPREDVAALFSQIRRAQRDLNMSEGRAIMQAVKHVSASLGTSSRVSPEYRPYREIGTTRKGDKKIYRISTYRGKHSYKGKFKQKFTRNAGLREGVAYARDEAHLKTFPSVKIKFRGLAKRSWTAFRGAGRAGGVKGITKDAIHAASRHMQFTSQMRGDDIWAKLSNKLEYIEDALNGGPKAVDEAIGRAARGMEESLNRQIAKKMGAR